MNRTSKWWIVGGIAATLIAVACVGALAVGMMFAGPRFGGQMMYRQPPAQIAPQPDNAPRAQPGQPDMRGFRGDDRGYYRDGYGGPFYQGRGMSPFGFIGGIFRLLFTLALIGLALIFLRRFFFGRGRGWGWGWGGPGRWGGPGGPEAHGDVPPWAEAWHRKMHEKMDAPAVAEAPAEPTEPAKPPAGDDAPAATNDAQAAAPADGDNKLI